PLAEDVESRHIRTIPAQMYDRETLRGHLGQLNNPAGLFVVSGGHPLRKLQKILEIYQIHIPLLEGFFRDQVDVRDLMDEANGAFPGRPILGAWNFHTDTPDRVAGKIHHGMGAMISQPASFMPDTFYQALMQLRSAPEGKEIPILVGLPHVTSLAALKFWFILMNIIPEKHPEAAFLLEKFEKANKDGYVKVFANQLTRNCLEWALSLAGASGIHFMGSKGESFALLGDVVGMGRHQNGFDHIAHQNAQDLHRAEQLFHAEGMRIIAPQGLYSSEKRPKNGPQYSAEFLPLLTPVLEKLQQLKRDYIDHPFWKNCEVYFSRMSANNHAHILPVEIITSDEGEVHEIRIDVRYNYNDITPFLDQLEVHLRAHLEEKPLPGVALFETKIPKEGPLLERLQKDSWDWFGALQAARGESGDAGTESAKSPEIIQASAEHIIEALEEAGNQSEYVILETGTWHANGIPETLDAVETLLTQHPQASILRARLQRTKYVCVDIAVEGVESCRAVLGTTHEQLGIGFEYIAADLMNDKDIREIHDKYKGKVIFARSINVLDALQNRQYIERHHQIYDMKYTTGIVRADLEKICSSDITYGPKDDKKILPIKIPVDDVISFFSESRPGPDVNEVKLFLNYLQDKHNITQSPGLILFEKIIQAMKKCHSYHYDKRADDIVQRVGAHHPDPQIPMTDSHQATTYLMALADMFAANGLGFFTQLQRTLGTHTQESHKTTGVPYTYHVTGCNPLAQEAVQVVAAKRGFTAQSLPGSVLGLRGSSGGLVIRRKKEKNK
ncbi:hypothetical protein KA057_04195, partial [Candidatus Gracilibacteria bacterium]|nr:hypothetical protein [Candidatus Gracilibacteria bacterium]